MRFTPFALLGYLFATFLLIQHVAAAPTKPPVERFSGTITFINHQRRLVSLTDTANKKFWPCDNENELFKEDIKLGDRVTFTKRLPASQTAHDVQKVWSDGTITFVKRVLGKDPGHFLGEINLVSLTDRSERVWFCDQAESLIRKGFVVGDKVRFKKSQQMSQSAFEVTKV